jgi:energy-coupling factor transport system permease protein
MSRTTNPLLLLLALAVLCFVVVSRRADAPWARAFRYYLILAAVIVVVRVVFRSVFGTGVEPGDSILFRLPHPPTPSWYAGVRFGGPVSLEGVLSSAVDGLRLGVILCCVGAANALANPKRALRLLPGALYELGVAVVVAISVAPQLVESVQRVARARRLRGGRRSGIRALRGIVIPVLEDALDRSLMLARAMDSRGYGRTGSATARSRRGTGALLVTGMLGLCVGVFGLLDAGGPRWLGLPALLAGAAMCAGGLSLGGRRISRTRYRPDPWRGPEWLVVTGSVTSAVLVVVAAHLSPAALDPGFSPLHAPPLPVIAVLALLVAGIAGLAAPAPTPATARAVDPPAPTMREAQTVVRVSA